MIYDCFTYNNEPEVLAVRLHELAPHVDHFVVCEANETHMGEAKPLRFMSHRAPIDLITPLTYIRLEALDGTTPRAREAYQRDRLAEGLFDKTLARCKPDDIILFSDVDEVPRGTLIEALRDGSEPLPHGRVLVFNMPMYTYAFNGSWTERWLGTTAMTYKTFLDDRSGSFAMVRKRRKSARRYGGMTAGWHFSKLGTPEKVMANLLACPDKAAALREPGVLTPETMHAAMARGEWILQEGDAWAGRRLTPVSVDETFPQYVQGHQTELAALILEVPA